MDEGPGEVETFGGEGVDEAGEVDGLVEGSIVQQGAVARAPRAVWKNVKMYSLEADVKAILTNYKIRHDLIKRKSHDIFHSALSITCIYYVKNLHIFSTVRTWSSIYFPGSHQFYH